jgi:phenylalanyl-tRNA synthetase beta chain
LFVIGNQEAESWINKPQQTSFFMLKAYVEGVLSRLGIQKIKYASLDNDVFSEGIVLVVGNESLVEMGVVKKSIAKKFDIKPEVLYADFNWAAVLKITTAKIKYNEIPKYPEVRRDLSLLIDNEISFDSIYNLSKQTEKTRLQNINLFDVYQGANLPEGKKSYTISFSLQDHTKTLTDTEIDAIMLKIQTQLQSKLGASLR